MGEQERVVTGTPSAPPDQRARQPRLSEQLRRLVPKDRAGRAGLVTLVVIVLAVVFAPAVAPAHPFEQNLLAALQPPSWAHPFGTDELGRDIFSRVLYGGRLSLTTAALASTVAAGLGMLIGLTSGFFGGTVDAVLMRIVDFLLAVPGMLLAIAIVAILGPGPGTIVVALSTLAVPVFARLVRARTLEIKSEEYVLAAECAGATRPYLMFRTILPNTLTTVIVQLAVTAAIAILLEAALSFLGFGAQLPQPSWGAMISRAKSYLAMAPWYAIFPGLALTITVLSVDALGRSLQRSVHRGPSLVTELRRGA